MRVLFWAVITVVGAIVGLGEVTYARYFAGEMIAQVVLFEEGKPKTHQISISQNDFPIRLNLKMWGGRERTSIANRSYVTLSTGGESPGDTIGFYPVIDEDSDLRTVTWHTGSFTLGPVDVPNLAQSSLIFDAATVGDWDLSASVSDEFEFSMDRIEAAIIRNSRAVNWQIAGLGLTALLVGFTMLVISLRRRYPHLAT